MAGLGYQAVQPASFDVTDIAAQADANKIKEQQLALQAMKARQAGEAKDKKTTLKTPWNYFAGVVGQASISLTDEMRQLESITNPTEKAAKKAEIEQKWENLAMFSEYTNGLKDNYNSINSKLGDKYYIEDKREFGNLPAELAQQTTFENGEIFIGGIPWKEAAASLRFQEPTPIYKDLFYEFSKENPPSKFLVQQGNVYVRNDEYLETTVQGAAENAIKLGYPESVVQEFVDNVITVYPKTRSLPDREGGGGGFTLNIGPNKYDTGKYQLAVSQTSEGSVITPTLSISYDGRQPPKEFTYYQEDNQKVTSPITISEIKKINNEYVLDGFGYKKIKKTNTYTDEEYWDFEPTESVRFTLNEANIKKVSNILGVPLESVFDNVKSEAMPQQPKQQEAVWVYGGEEYTLKELQDTYGKDFNPSEYDGFQQKK